MRELEEFERMLDVLIEGYKKLKEENRELWLKVKNLTEKVTNLEKEKKELEELLESQKKALGALVERLQRFLSITAEQGLIWNEKEDNR